MSTHRASEPGWSLVGEMLDPAGRRGVWYRTTPVTCYGETITRLEICAGREGDDNYAVLLLGETVNDRTLHEFADALNTGEWCVSLRNDKRQFDVTVLDRAVTVRVSSHFAERPIANAEEGTINAAIADCLEEIARRLRGRQ